MFLPATEFMGGSFELSKTDASFLVGICHAVVVKLQIQSIY